jgi:hypothetical protein
MFESQHSMQPAGEAHVIARFAYADQSDRESHSNPTIKPPYHVGALVAADITSVAQQEDDGSLWILTNHSPITWVAIGAGEANSASNIGGEAEVFKSKVGVDLQFRTIKAGSGASVVQNANDVEISVTPGAVPNHATEHEDGGGDEIDVSGLSGELADPQPPKSHDIVTGHTGTLPHSSTGGITADDHHAHGNKAEIDLVTDGDHDVRVDNPHGVTAVQAGASPTGHTHAHSATTGQTENDHHTRNHNLISTDHPDVSGSPSTGDTLVWNGAAWAPATISGFDPTEWLVIEHFLSGNHDTDEWALHGWREHRTGTGQNITVTGQAGHPGIAKLESGTSLAARCALYLGNTVDGTANVLVGGSNEMIFEAMIRFEDTIGSADVEDYEIGLGGQWGGDVINDNGVWIRFQPATDTYLSLVCANATVRTVSASDVVPALNTWYRVGFVISDPGGTPSVQMYINGVAKGTPITTNIPSGLIAPGMKIRAAGGSSGSFLIDYFNLRQQNDGED